MSRWTSDKKHFLFFWVFATLGIFLGVAAYSEALRPFLNFLWSSLYLIPVQIALVIAFCYLIFRWAVRTSWSRTALQWVYGLLFLPLLILPIFRCYFKVPYVFCRACPTPCPWGIMRTFAFSGFILMNCFGKFWCSSLCPFGTFQECQSQSSKKRFKLARGWAIVPYLILLLVAGMYFLTLFGLPLQRFFELGKYTWVAMTVAVTAIILAVAFFIPKFFCRYACPVGAIAELTSSFQKKKS